MPNQNIKQAAPIYNTMIIAMTILSALAIIAGIVTFFLGQINASLSEIDFLGATIKTQNIGVAVIGLGVLSAYFTFKKVLENMHKMKNVD